MFRKNIFLSTIAIAAVAIAFVGCDLGTYQKRVNENPSQTNTLDQEDEGGDGSASEN